jgi:hypothetical protein
MTRFTLALLLFCLGSVAQSQIMVYREFFFSGQPADSYFDGLGMKRGHVVYEAEVTGGTPPLKKNLMISTAQRTASTFPTYENRMWYDFEYLSCDSFAVGKTKAIANAETLATYIRYAKQAAPTLQVGLYSVVPPRDIYIWAHLAQRQSADNLVQSLADVLDFLTPSCYLFYSEATIPFIKYAVPMVQEAKRMAKGKKVIAFIAPGYHDAGAFPNQYASKAVWANVLNVIKNSGADGMTIFAGKGAMGSQPYNWSYIDTCGWWQATKEFLAANTGAPPPPPPPPPTTIGTPTVISPASGQVIDPRGWTSVWRKVAGSVKYQFQLANNSSFSSPLISDSTITDTTRGMGTIAYGTTYYIRVRAKGSSGWGSYGSTLQFNTSGTTTVSISAPTIISPVAGQVIDPRGWTSVWRKVTGAVKYQFQLSSSSSFSSTLISDSTVTDTTRGMGTLAYGITYYIHVRTKGSSGWGSYGSTTQFNTLASASLLMAQESGVPTSFDLAQNYPNPFNPTTLIRFSLPVGSHVRLTVFNSLGQVVRTLVDGDREAGYYEEHLDGANLASGIYFYRIEAGSFAATKKLLLLK